MLDNLSILPLVITAGFLDGLSPCVIAILVFFIAFLLSMRKTFKNIFSLGLLYIFVIFLTYLSVGVGLFSGIMLFGRHHFFAELGSGILILWGIIEIKNYFFPNSPIQIGMPKKLGEKSKALIEKATIPAIILSAFLVGLCSVPCSAGIYTAITSFLASKTTYWTGFLYLIVYNVMVIIPLLIILGLSVNPFTLAKITEFRQKNEKLEKLVMGISMVILGILILVFLI
ncbi:MAG: hypothetical protein KJI70_01330 [Patescibacteria group bacterium]|nr:hypothetical protein [Patescibacteria group bacterium]